jgi:hypothetical protein
MLAMLAPGAAPALRASLRERYGCQVSTDASLRACEAVAGRLESSVTPARMAELGRLRQPAPEADNSVTFIGR